MSNRFKTKYSIKKGDQVVVISGSSSKGNDKNKVRTVTHVFPTTGLAIVEGANMKTKHMKPSARNSKGSIIKKEAPIHLSNLMLWDKKAQAPTRTSRMNKDGVNVRVAKKSGEEI
ncbi:MAG: 50S ribosomal protein L24 [Sediminibacterium sp.]|nr:50S ribosomal protein L24 [Sediminibacterium sp.]